MDETDISFTNGNSKHCCIDGKRVVEIKQNLPHERYESFKPQCNLLLP